MPSVKIEIQTLAQVNKNPKRQADENRKFNPGFHHHKSNGFLRLFIIVPDFGCWTGFVSNLTQLIYLKWAASQGWRFCILWQKTKNQLAIKSLTAVFWSHDRNPRLPIAWSRRWELNPQPTVYDTVALPLSYFGARRLAGRQYRCSTGLSFVGKRVGTYSFVNSNFTSFPNSLCATFLKSDLSFVT